MPKVSVVMPSFNHAAFVQEAVESVLSQTFQDFELIVTDDGSTDATVEIVRRISDPRINLVAFAKNQGACVAMNESIRRAKGDYLAALNSDDAFVPYKLERQVEFLEKNPRIAAVFALPQFVDERSHPVRPPSTFADSFAEKNRTRMEWLARFFQSGNCLCHPTVLVRRRCYEEVGLFDPLLMQLPDLDQWVRLCAKFELHVLPERLTRFRVLKREMNTSAPSPARMARHAWEITTVLSRYLRLPEQEMAKLVSDEALQRTDDVVAAFAITAIQTGRPGYVQFGASLLRERLAAKPGVVENRDYFSLIATADPCGAKFEGRFFRDLAGSPVLSQLRGALRKLRARRP
jgi:glycosyltransferase involved in cell wall biosynthesis